MINNIITNQSECTAIEVRPKNPQIFQIICNKYNSPLRGRHKPHANEELQFYLLNLGLLSFLVTSLLECILVTSKTTWRKWRKTESVSFYPNTFSLLTLIVASITCWNILIGGTHVPLNEDWVNKLNSLCTYLGPCWRSLPKIPLGPLSSVSPLCISPHQVCPL